MGKRERDVTKDIGNKRNPKVLNRMKINLFGGPETRDLVCAPWVSNEKGMDE